jgi:hypothetical protein
MFRFWESRSERDLRERVRRLEGELATSRAREDQLVDKIVLLAGLRPLQKHDVDETPATSPNVVEIPLSARRTPVRLAARRERALATARKAREAPEEETDE